MLENQDDVFSMSDEDLEALARGEETITQSQPEEQEVQQPEEKPLEQEQPLEEEPEQEEEPESVEVDKAQKGLQREIAEQRKRRREAEHELAIVKAKLELQSQQPVVPTPKPFDDLSDDEIVDGKAIKTVYSEVEEMRKQIELQKEQLYAERARLESERIQRSEESAKADFAKGKVKDGYDYDTVMADFEPILKSNPNLQALIRQSADPAREAYKQAVLLKDPLSLVRMPTKSSAPKKAAPTTIGSAPAGGGQSNEINLSTITEAQLNDENKISYADLIKLAKQP